MKQFKKTSLLFIGLSISVCILACNGSTQKITDKDDKKVPDSLLDYVDQRLAIYEKVQLTTNLNVLSASERKVLPLLIEAAKIMDDLFWKQAYPQRDSLLATIKDLGID